MKNKDFILDYIKVILKNEDDFSLIQYFSFINKLKKSKKYVELYEQLYGDKLTKEQEEKFFEDLTFLQEFYKNEYFKRKQN